jgi:archaellum component FlaC
MSEFISINNHEGLIRDSHSKALLNTDKESLEAWKKRKNKTNQIENHELEINNIKDELGTIKTMLEQIVKRIK